MNKIMEKVMENTYENRERLARHIVSLWDLGDLVAFAEGRLMDTWDPNLSSDADDYFLEDCAMHEDDLNE